MTVEANDAPSISSGTATFTGNQSSGITRPSANPPVTTYFVNSLSGAIAPASGTSGISLTDGGAANLTINAGVVTTPITIRTSGTSAFGIQAVSVGQAPSNPPVDPFLGVVIPTAQNAAGGIVTVNSYSNITTTGDNAFGIYAQSSTSGYPPSVVAGLQNFSATGFTFAISKVFNADGTTGTVGQAVQTSLVDVNGNPITGTAGKVTVNADGTFSAVAGTGFDSIPVGQSVHVVISYQVTGTSPASGNPKATSDAKVVLTITKTASGFTTSTVGSSFALWGGGSTVFPDLNSYVHSLAGIATAGGAGNTVNVTSNGNIQTSGAGANGIVATSQGGRGGNGDNASLTHSSTQGGDGSKGGNVNVTANGTITVSQASTVGVLAYSTGGDGGTGGDSGFARNSKDGGAGGTGGDVNVMGNGTINTNGFRSTGILALSAGGNGGSGGDGGTTNGASNGGAGGRGGVVNVNGSWTITTVGDQAHGIWAKSLGGYAGNGGGGGWTGTSSGSGGVGTDGGTVTIISDGRITTTGVSAYGIYGESIGGFGGGGGSGSSIFYASGGSGTSAGSGGSVVITNGVNGVITTNMADSHGIFGQSIGGGGGSGGGGGVGLVTVGGSGSTGGNGGSVTITNNGTIITLGSGSKGIYAQSIGGGGGDGGSSVGLAAIGGSGSTTSAGGNVIVVNTGSITTTSNAIFAQSIGGGGGNGGSSSGWFSFGGSSGSGGDAGTVIVTSSGTLTTTEGNASAIFAQSLGGGGGNGGNSTAVGAFGSLAIGGSGSKGGNGGDVTVGVNGSTSAISPVTGTITTSGDFARGIQAQSIGGGGGNGGYAFSGSISPGSSVSVGVGGSGAGGGNAGTVEVLYGDAASSIMTSGEAAHGIMAQSIGGGGGAGGFSVAATVGAGFNAAVSLGGNGGKGGDAEAVYVGTSTNYTGGTITTSGEHSDGIFAQSVGGGGGDGGFSVAGSASVTGFAGGSFSFGGSGSAGGAAGIVDVFSGTQILTTGVNSHGIAAQSIGGGGGSGGFSIAGTVSTGVAMSLSMGGEGGKGGAAGNVEVHSVGSYVQTTGDRSYGILAQSIGGSGGDGGFSIAAGVSAAPSLGFSMGGAGGTAGDAGTVLLANSSIVTTEGNDAHALFAQSVGGGGGSGGFSVAASVSVDPTGSGAGAAINASIGGAGASGGIAQAVTVTSNGAMLGTIGDHSYGILAQSIGGGGGDGGFSIGGSISTGPAVSFSMGGNGSKGGGAGTVHVDSSSNIITYGKDSTAIFAQSVGGGGGNGGFSVAGAVSVQNAGVGVSLGGSGAGGGNGGDVTVGYVNPITGQITTYGDASKGIVAQSIGGGGGNGGFSVEGSLSSSAAVGFSMGGAGGTASGGGIVILNSGASISTAGVGSTALFAQSVGGGGGDGGFSIGANFSISSGALTASIGGSGGAGGTGGSVTMTSTGNTITTGGDRSDGLLAQSIGGGGGNGGFSIGAGLSNGPSASFSMGGSGDFGGGAGVVHVDSSSNITTYGNDSTGIFAQSVGGGGGNGGFSINGSFSADSGGVGVSIGGSGKGGGIGGDVTVGYLNPITGQIVTYGDHSYGVVAQSVGGGGGNGGFSISGALTSSAAVNFTMGGKGGTASNGGIVVLNSAASVYTSGANSDALFAQSVGGGGGNGGFSIGGSFSDSSGAVSASVGGQGGGGGNGGNVSITSTGNTISTSGDHSFGITVQSIGGGGGEGGFSITAGIGESTSLNVGVGGKGGTGGTAGTAYLNNSSAVFTDGEVSYGLFAQSVGGGGGDGGFSLTGSISAKGNGIGVSIGGSGGVAGAGNTVTVINSGAIQTGGIAGTGKGSYGIFAQSVGGGGGAGGFSGSFVGSLGEGNALSVSVGGFGGAGGAANAVSVTNSGTILTTAADSTGIFAQSIGGGGGDGGFSLSAALAEEQKKASVSVSIGGFGGKGGNGSTVTIINNQMIETLGDHSQGILAQSIGGGGGNGGFSVATNLSSGDEAKGFSASIGGSGGTAGDAAKVSVTNNAAIRTEGADSAAILAQSIGGGGGNGGFSVTGSLAGTQGKSIGVSVGGNGSGGGIGGTVEVLGNSGTNNITTLGDRSDGIFAQSVGGSGGNGGFSASVAVGLGGNDVDKPSTSISVAVGGTGGTGNIGGIVNIGTVTSRLTGDIVTLGTDSVGIFAQSIGGGGGNGGFAFSGAINLAAGQDGPNTDVAIAVGGQGGTGNNGGAVNVYHTGGIGTDGDGAYGIQAQSIGGGGGNGGAARSITLQLGEKPTEDQKEAGAKNKSLSLAIGGSGQGGGDGGVVTVDNVGDIVTTGGDAYGIFAQSIGGGGGSGGDAHQGFPGSIGLKKYDRAKFTKNLKIVVGGSGGSSGDGKTVNITNTGAITTYGDGSRAVFAQSIGGGGGAGGNGDVGLLGTIGVGGGTGSTGTGGAVNVTINGSIDTYGNGATGIFAQSIGGGGGAAGDVDRGLTNYLNIGTGLAFGQGSGSGGDGGIVTIISNANITTRGTGADGILAQSVGGGGGVGGSLGNDLPVLNVLNFAGSVGGTGSGGLVQVTQVGNIITLGDGSRGIFAQSAGGTGTGGIVTIDVTGNVAAFGESSDAIFAQSVGQGGQSNITVTIQSGIVQGGTSTGSGVRFADGKDNLLTNKGTVQTAAGMSGTAIFGTSGNETVDNFGTVNDSIDLGTGTNTFNNKAGALLQSGDYIKLGAGNTLFDAGTISPGGLNAVQTTQLTGNFTLTGDSRWTFDLTPTFDSDRFAISGTANLGSYVNRIDLNEIVGIANGPGVYTLITAASGLTGKFQFGSFTGGTMPIGFTFDLINSDTQEQLTLSPSTGPFYWRGTVDSTWNGSFLDGQDNWTRDAAGNTFIFGTPGVACDVFFASTNANSGNLMTTLGANFVINSLTFQTSSDTGIAGDNLLTLAASGGQGITVQAGAGTPTITAYLELGADQTWTNLSSNPLQIFAPAIIGDGKKLTIDGTGNTNITSVIDTGAGSLTKNGTGTLFLTGQSYFGGGTILNNGTLDIDVDSTPSGAVLPLSPVKTGPLGVGVFTINGGTVGTSTFSGTNTAHTIGNYVFVNDSFSISNVPAGAAPAPVSPIDGGVLNSQTAGLFKSDGVNFAGEVFLKHPGSPIVITTKSGFLAITGSIHDYTPGVGGGLTFAGNTITYLGSAGAPTTLKVNQIAGQTDISNTYTGTTTVASGVLILGKNKGAQAIPGNLVIDRGAYVQLDGFNSVNRVGALGTTPNQINPNATVIDNGTFDIAGINQTIATLYGNGIVRLDDSNLFNGTGIGAIGILHVGSGNFSGTIIDGNTGSSLVKFGSGKLILSGTNTFIGGTFIDEGTLAVNGSIFSQKTFVGPWGTLQGTGWIYGNVLNNGLVSPGNSPGTLHVSGNYKQTNYGTLKIEIGGLSLSQHDLLQVNGAADLSGGTLQLVRLNNFRLHRGDRVEFLTANGGVTGKFDLVLNPFTSATILEPSVVYRGNTVSLELVQGSFADFARFHGLTPNQRAVANELDRIVYDRRADKLIGWLDERNLDKLPGDFDKIAAEELTSIFTIGTSLAQAQSANIQRRNDDVRSGTGGFNAAGLAVNGMGPSYSGGFFNTGVGGPNGDDGKASQAVVTPEEARWGAFLSGTGEWVSVGNTDNARGYNLDSGGFTLGLDYKVTPNIAIGLAAGYTGTTADLTDGGRVYVNGGKIGLYATFFDYQRIKTAPTTSKDSFKEAPAPTYEVAQGLYADVAVFGGYNSYDTRRSALQGEARGDTDGGELNVLFGAGYDFRKGHFTFGPTASFNYTYLGTNAFTEHGSLAPLDIHGGKGESLRTAFGIKASYDWKVGGVLIKPEIRASWQHEYGDAAYALDSNFANGAGDSFRVNGPQLGRDSVLLGAGFAIQFNERCATYFYYDGDLGRRDYQSTSVTGGLRLSF